MCARKYVETSRNCGSSLRRVSNGRSADGWSQMLAGAGEAPSSFIFSPSGEQTNFDARTNLETTSAAELGRGGRKDGAGVWAVDGRCAERGEEAGAVCAAALKL